MSRPILLLILLLALAGCQISPSASSPDPSPTPADVTSFEIVPQELIHPLGIVKESTETSETFQVYLEIAVPAPQAEQYYQALPEWSKELIVSSGGVEVLRLRKTPVIVDLVLTSNGETSTAVFTGLVAE